MLCQTGLIFPLTNRLADSILKNIMVVGLEIMKSANFIEYPPPFGITILIFIYLIIILFHRFIDVKVYTNRAFHTTIQQHADCGLSSI